MRFRSIHANLIRSTAAFAPSLLIAGFLVAGESQLRSRYPITAVTAGELCVVCGMPVSSDDVTIILKGRRFPVMRTMAAEVLKDPEKYLKGQQVKGALFQEDFQASAGTAQTGIKAGWFLGGLYFLTALIFAGLSGATAIAKGLPPISSFLLGLCLNVLGYLYVLTRPQLRARPVLAKVPLTQTPLVCPQCGNTNHPSAASCAVCHVSLSPQGHSDLSCAG